MNQKSHLKHSIQLSSRLHRTHPKYRNMHGEPLSLMCLCLHPSCRWLNSFEAKAMLLITHLHQPHLAFVSELALIYSSHCWTFRALDNFSPLTQQAINNYCLNTLDKQLWKSWRKDLGVSFWLVGWFFVCFICFFDSDILRVGTKWDTKCNLTSSAWCLLDQKASKEMAVSELLRWIWESGQSTVAKPSI